MPTVTYIECAGSRRDVDASAGASAMQAALAAGLDGIAAECGGNAMCATCHVYVEEAWLYRLPPMEEDEDVLLEGVAAERRPTSRLSCQIRLTAELDGLILHLPERQV